MKYETIISGQRVTVDKKYRGKTQYEWYLKIYMGVSNWESILLYQELHLTRKGALNHAKDIIENAPKPRIEKIFF